jgi:antiviral helicase SKI2
MDTTVQKELIHQIIHPNPEDAQKILEDLGLAGLPSPKQVHQEIEEKLLLPRDTLPDHWLPSYQLYVSLIVQVPPHADGVILGIGTNPYQYHLYCN